MAENLRLSVEFNVTGEQRVKTATRSLKALKREEVGVATAAKGMGASTSKAGASIGAMGVKTQAVSRSTRQLTADLSGLRTMMVGIGAIAAGAFLSSAYKQASAFNKAMAEVSTLVDTSVVSMSELTDAANEMSMAYGQDAITTAKAFYQTISAGATTAAEATAVMDQANKLAVGGVTDVATASDGLTTVLNAWQLSARDASGVSDTLFTTMRLGKTTIGELSANIGAVAPIASQAGISFDELMASVATLTKAGIDTGTAMMNMRQFITNIIKPSSQAARAAKEYGVELGASALATKGLAGWIAELEAKTGGSAEKIAKLFANVRSMTPAMALAGKMSGEFANSLDAMENKSGSATEAVKKMMATMSFQADQFKQKGAASMREVGNAIGEALLPMLTALNDHFFLVEGAAAGLAAMLVTALIPSIYALTTAMLANPLFAGVAAVGAIVAGGTALLGYLDNIEKKAIATGKAIQAVFDSKELAKMDTVTKLQKMQRAHGELHTMLMKVSTSARANGIIIGESATNAGTLGRELKAAGIEGKEFASVNAQIETKMRDLETSIQSELEKLRELKRQSAEAAEATNTLGTATGNTGDQADELATVLADANRELRAAKLAAELAGEGFGDYATVLQAIQDLTSEDGILPGEGSIRKLVDIRTEMEGYATEAEEAAKKLEKQQKALEAMANLIKSGGLGTLFQFGGGAIGGGGNGSNPFDDLAPQFGLAWITAGEELVDEAEKQGDLLKAALEIKWDEVLGTAPGGKGGDEKANAIGATANGISQLVQSMDGLDNLTKNLVGAFAGLAQAMSQGTITASDWITLIVQIAMAMAGASKQAHQERVQELKELSAAFNDLRTSLNKLEAETTKINEKYDEIREQIQSVNNGWDNMRDSMKKIGEAQTYRESQESALAEAERKRAIELEMATRKVQQEGYQGMIDLLDHLALYIEDQAIADNLSRLRLELEIINMRIQLDTLKALGTIAEETLFWIEGMIDVVEAGLRDGSFQVGGRRRGGGGGNHGPSGPNPRETWNGMLEQAREFAAIQENTFGDMAAHFASMREHSDRMNGNAEERAAREAEIMALERAAAEEYGLTLLERMYKATGNEEALHDLERIRFEAERIHTLSQIDLLLASGLLTDGMTERLIAAREEFENFVFPDLPGSGDDDDTNDDDQERARLAQETRDAWTSILRETNTLGDEILADWDAMNKAAIEMARLGELTADEFMKVVDHMRQQASLAALDMIEAAAEQAKDADLMERAARARFAIEKAIQLGEIQVMRATLVAMGGMADIIEMLDEALALVLDSEFAWEPPNWNDVTEPITTAISDQTDALQDALDGLNDTMWDLLLGDQSTLSPEQQYQQALGHYQSLVNRAQGGDIDAITELQSFAPEFLAILESYSGGINTSLYASGFAQVIADLANITGMANPLAGMTPVGGVGFGGASGNGSNVIGGFQSFNPDTSPLVQTQRDHKNEAHTDSVAIQARIDDTNDRLDRLADAIEDLTSAVA